MLCCRPGDLDVDLLLESVCFTDIELLPECIIEYTLRKIGQNKMASN